MHDHNDWKSRIRAAFTTDARVPDDDVLEELAAHSQELYESARTSGCSHDEASSRVDQQIVFWRQNASTLKRIPQRSLRPAAPPPSIAPTIFGGLAHDIVYAARQIRRQSRYALLSIVTMALGIGASTVLFSAAYGVLIRPFPWPNGDRLVVLKETRGGLPPRFGSFTNAAYMVWRDQMKNIEDIAGWSQRDVTLSSAGEPARIRVVFTTASLFKVLGVRPLVGALFEAKDETTRLLVLSESLWRERFGGDPGVLGSIVQLDGQPYSIVGVLGDAVAYPDQHARAWAPMRVRATNGNSLSLFSAIASLQPGATPTQASAEGTTRGRFVPDTGLTTTAIFGGNGPVEVYAQPLRDALAADVRRPLFVLLAAVGMLFAAATANIASLQLAHATTRRRELAIRRALGANRVRMGRQLLIENLMLGLIGGGAGLLITLWLHSLMPSLLPADFPRLDSLSVNWTVVLFAMIASLGASITCGLLPAWYVHRLGLAEALAQDGSGAVGPSRISRSAQTRMMIMAAQVAVACVLLVGASLLIRSFVSLLNVDRGYDPSGVLTARLTFPDSLYTPEQRSVITDELLHRLSAIPGMSAVSFTSELPLTPGGSTAAMTMKEPGGNGIITAQASPRIVSPEYFAALRSRVDPIRLLK